MLSSQYASRHLAPLLMRNGTRAAFQRSARLPRHLPAVAILIPHRAASTETTSEQNGSAPPPGFNISEARKPLANSSEQSKPAVKADGKPDHNISIPVAQPTEHAPTSASEQAALNEIAAQHAQESAEDKKDLVKKEEKNKLTLWQKVKHEAQHYWDGTKLLATEVRISSRLALKMAAGYELTRREHRQLQRTVQDLGRLVPFSVFVIVPFAELLLPVALRLFPNMLPSTYENAASKESKAMRLRTSRKEVSQLLRSTLRESGLPISPIHAQKEEFTEFFRKLRATGEEPTKADVIKVCKLFKDDLTLDNLSRPQLVGICRYMALNTFGTDPMLRYQVRHRMRQIKRDDRAISFEGVESLSVPELQTACAARGLRTHGMSPGRLRDDLQLWLDLRLKYGVPSTLLVLSNAFMYAQGKEVEFDSQLSALQAVLSSIPEELFHEIELEVHNAEGAVTNKQRLQVLKEQQELIQEENEQAEEQKASGGTVTSVSDKEDIDEKEEEARQESALSKAAAQDILESEGDLAQQQKLQAKQADEEKK
ncbi:LETM1-domain-containing protein [Dissoconium aciculare CBS 342.82]|uniref:LETM1-domain-containing protein n=1 Tax=Dissoconium aciculare CBS 342.82 TaxID=1314786 RepID=A0A6J3LY28_9PEZI|nr:LETM1-domain-containing protein [Dissoconium aciculare CBS 342.82]KAF1819542.1 LETM1-domain-containing protein [Dissoconium aciculare CBS 342.82]